MIYIVKAKSLNLLAKKVQVVFDTLKSSSNEWEYIYDQSVEDAINLASRDIDGNYKTTIFFRQVPIMKNYYHGILGTCEQEARKQRAV